MEGPATTLPFTHSWLMVTVQCLKYCEGACCTVHRCRDRAACSRIRSYSCEQLCVSLSAELSRSCDSSAQVLLCEACMLNFGCCVYRWLQT